MVAGQQLNVNDDTLVFLDEISLQIHQGNDVTFPKDICKTSVQSSIQDRSIYSKSLHNSKSHRGFGWYIIQRLLVQCLSNVNSASYCTAYHRVVADAEEAHHLHVGRNWWGTCELSVRVHTAHCVGHSLRSEYQQSLYRALRPCKPLLYIRILTHS